MSVILPSIEVINNFTSALYCIRMRHQFLIRAGSELANRMSWIPFTIDRILKV